ncbi:MAG: bacillithiol biosynthesis BshC, partial [bacterium]
MTIPYNSLPSYNELFIKYIESFESLKKFYDYNYSSDEDFLKCIEHKKQNYLSGKNFFRNDICEILRIQNEKFNSSGKTFENIKLLGEHDTFVVITGQQLGMLTGPYYTILKAINTIQLSSTLNKKYTGYKFVPVFWLESDDHDFLEINNINIITKDNDLKNIKYFEKGEQSEKYLKPAGNILLDEHIDNFINELEDSLTKTEFTEALFDQIKNSYKTGVDF